MIPRLYAILDYDVARQQGWTLVDLAKACFDGGARLVQVRAKSLASGPLFDLASSIVRLSDLYGARVIVNDRADVARLTGAAGVHVGQDDLAPRSAREVVGPSTIVGLSTHTVDQVMRALDEPIDYLAIGPVFETKTKARPYPTIGLDGVRATSQLARQKGVPLVAIGGITFDRVRDVVQAGADSIAVISDLLATGDPTMRVRTYLDDL